MSFCVNALVSQECPREVASLIEDCLQREPMYRPPAKDICRRGLAASSPALGLRVAKFMWHSVLRVRAQVETS